MTRAPTIMAAQAEYADARAELDKVRRSLGEVQRREFLSSTEAIQDKNLPRAIARQKVALALEDCLRVLTRHSEKCRPL